MLIGASPFHGETATDSIGAVLHKDLDLDLLPPTTPVNARRVLNRCLERDKSKRYRDIGDVRIDLQAPPDEQESRDRGRTAIPWGIAAISAAIAIGAILLGITAPSQPMGSPKHKSSASISKSHGSMDQGPQHLRSQPLQTPVQSLYKRTQTEKIQFISGGSIETRSRKSKRRGRANPR